MSSRRRWCRPAPAQLAQETVCCSTSSRHCQSKPSAAKSHKTKSFSFLDKRSMGATVAKHVNYMVVGKDPDKLSMVTIWVIDLDTKRGRAAGRGRDCQFQQSVTEPYLSSSLSRQLYPPLSWLPPDPSCRCPPLRHTRGCCPAPSSACPGSWPRSGAFPPSRGRPCCSPSCPTSAYPGPHTESFPLIMVFESDSS